MLRSLESTGNNDTLLRQVSVQRAMLVRPRFYFQIDDELGKTERKPLRATRRTDFIQDDYRTPKALERERDLVRLHLQIQPSTFVSCRMRNYSAPSVSMSSKNISFIEALPSGCPEYDTRRLTLVPCLRLSYLTTWIDGTGGTTRTTIDYEASKGTVSVWDRFGRSECCHRAWL